VQAVIRIRVEMGKLATDQESLRRSGVFARRQDERPGARNRDAAGLLHDARQLKYTARELLDPA
jgi:hypothetical protein